MPWQFCNDSPIYTQLVERMTRAIITGEYTVGERLPSVRDLAAQAGVNPNTMQRALSELEQSGLIYTQRTSGRYVTGDQNRIHQAKQSLARQQIETFLTAMKQLGFSRQEVLHLLREEEMKEELEHADTGV